MSLDATGFRNFSIMKVVFELQHEFIESSNQMSTNEVFVWRKSFIFWAAFSNRQLYSELIFASLADQVFL